MLKFLQSSGHISAPVQPEARLDGYTATEARVIVSFQASVEASGICDYDILRSVLLLARAGSVNVNAFALNAAYNELYARYYMHN